MNANIQTPAAYAARSTAPVVIPPPRPEPRRRDFGIGYGRSNGYFKRSGYAPNSMSPRFRVG